MAVALSEAKNSVALTGHVGDRDGTEILRHVERLLSKGAQVVTLDMSDAVLIDSEVLGRIIFAHRACEQRGAALRLVNVNRAISEILAITQLNRVLCVESV
jgi:anti-anti-sigma factor